MHRIATLLLSAVFLLPLQAAAAFPDIPAGTLEAEAANTLSTTGVIKGFPDGTFGGFQSVNRAQAAKILLLAAGIPVEQIANNGKFSDVQEGAWYVPYIMTAQKLGIIKGYSNGTFGPERQVNTVEFLKMMTLAFNAERNLDHSYADVSNQWFAEYAGLAWMHGLFPNRSPTHLFPERTLSRFHVVVAIYKYLQVNADSNQPNAPLIPQPTPQATSSSSVFSYNVSIPAFGEYSQQSQQVSVASVAGNVPTNGGGASHSASYSFSEIGPQTYAFEKTSNPSASSIVFMGQKGGIPLHTGRFEDFEVSMQYEEVAGNIVFISSLSFRVDINSMHTDSAGLTSHLLSADFFDAQSHPTASFASTKIHQLENGAYEVQGKMTMKGEQHPVTFTASINQKRLSAQYELNRLLFGVGSANDGVDAAVPLIMEIGFE